MKMMSFVLERARQLIREKGGFLTTQDAIKELARKDFEHYQSLLDDLIAEENDDGKNRAVLLRWKTLPPAKVVDEISIALANYLKKVQQTDPRFYWFKLENHTNDPETFDQILAELKLKGLMSHTTAT